MNDMQDNDLKNQTEEEELPMEVNDENGPETEDEIEVEGLTELEILLEGLELTELETEDALNG